MIDGNAVDVNCEISSMVRIESSNEILVRFPSSLMLHRVKTGNRTGENIDRCAGGPKLKIFLPDACFGGG